MILEPVTSAAEEIRRTCALLMAPGDVHEIRILNAGREQTVSGYFDHVEKLIAAVLAYDGRHNVYITLNPVNPVLLARACNRLEPRAKATTADRDILRRRRILVDIDPVRPTGISATEAEHQRAIAVGLSVWDCFRGELGDPEAVASSGNGLHLTYLADLPNDAHSTELVKGILGTIAKRCATPDVSIDSTVHNSGRVLKLWGTLAVKGDATSDRPHRRSGLLEVRPEL
jgi:hypothetical protein